MVTNTPDSRERNVKSTLVVSPRERFGVAVQSLLSIVEKTEGAYELIYIDGASPKKEAKEISKICEINGFRYIRLKNYVSPNQARNMGQRLASTDYVVFIDNDVIVSEGWLRALEECAADTSAEVVVPLTCQSYPLHQVVHQAGGEFTDDLSVFFAERDEYRSLTDKHLHQGKKVEDVDLERGETQCCEFHCVLVRRSVFERFGDLDEDLLATKEHIDFSMTILSGRGKIVFEPASVVTYLFPNRFCPMSYRDWPYFVLRWSPDWQRRSLRKLKKKWNLEHDPCIEKLESSLDWRLSAGIVRPLAQKIPLVSKSYKGSRVATVVLLVMVRIWSRYMVARCTGISRSVAGSSSFTGNPGTH